MHSFQDDNELDQYSRSAAEAFEAPSPADWDKMQRVLDRELPQQDKRRGGFIWWILPAILVAGLGFYWINNASNKTATKTITKTFINSNNHPSTASVVSINKSLESNNLVATKQTTTVSKKLIYTAKQSSNERAVTATSIHKTETQTAEIKEPEIKNSKEACCAVKSELVEPKKEVSPETISNNATTNLEIAPKKETVTPVASNSLSKKKNSNKGFFVGLTGGFDASTVNYAYASNVGYNIGGSLGYRFNSHWSVQTGAIYTRKNYKLKGEDFHAPKGTWVSYYNIETVDGFCKMWDIPVMATYHFTGNENGNAFISVGSSSYFMKNENYNYLYHYNNQLYTRSSNYNSTDQHIFALLHLSAGVERPIGKSFAAIIEPYAKIPLGGVGFGSILLSSYGLNFSLQYRQPKK